MSTAAIGAAMDAAGNAAHVGRTLVRAGLVRPLAPRPAVRGFRELRRWGRTFAGVYTARSHLYPDELALIDDLGGLTYAEVHDRTSRLAAALAGQGIAEGDRVALMCRNHRGFVEPVIALSKLGADTLLLNTGFAGPQLTDVVNRENPRAVIYDNEFSALVADAITGRAAFVAWTDPDAREDSNL
jgi:acyl-CoA synthetase (AMP-forming)/AMP-acid ligase II